MPLRCENVSREALERRHEAEVVERRGPQLDGERTDVLERLDDERPDVRLGAFRLRRPSSRRGST